MRLKAIKKLHSKIICIEVLPKLKALEALTTFRINILFLFFLSLFFYSCPRKEAPRILNRTCITTQHHELIIGNIDVYIKYDASDFNFPGYEDLAEYDTLFTTNAAGFGCIENLPIGRHWMIGLGFDEQINLAIKGRKFIDVSFENPEINDILYVGEE